MHRDLKLENILIHKDDTEEAGLVIKIADFGLAQQLKTPDEQLTYKCGSPGYLGPELLAENGYGLQLDVFSVGAVLFNL